MNIYQDSYGVKYKIDIKHNKCYKYEITESYDYGGDIAPNWKSEHEMNDELSKLCKELGYIIINEVKNAGWKYDDGKDAYLKGNNGVDLTLMIDDKMVMFELKNSGYGFSGAQGLGQLMYYMEKDKDYMKWREDMGIEYNDYRILEHSGLMGILVLTDGRNIKYLLKMIERTNYPIKILVFNPVILKFKSEKDRFIKSLEDNINLFDKRGD